MTLLLLLAACDTSFSGGTAENAPPDTELSVRDVSLVDNLGDAERLASTLRVSWSGTDADGYVIAYDLRFYDDGDAPAPEEGWSRTTRSDTLILLPIQPGQRTANVVFEVRAIDNEGALDPDPARTVFPIQNAPPELRFISFELPPDTTFSVASFSFEATDPEGEGNLKAIELSLNDSTQFLSIDPAATFFTLVGEIDRDDDTQTTTSARLYLGRDFIPTELTVPNLRLDADNTLYLRAVDQTDTTSTAQRFTWYVKKPKSDVLYVNDYRITTSFLQPFHLGLLRDYGLSRVDVWDLSRPTTAEAGRRLQRSRFLPVNADPMLRQTLALYRHIYWVSNGTTNSASQNNLPFAAAVLDLFFEQGGTILVHSPISPPGTPEEAENSAVLLLPLSSPIVYPDSLRLARLRLPPTRLVTPVGPVPGLGRPLPALSTTQTVTDALPYSAEDATQVPLYEANFSYIVAGSGAQGTWPGAPVVASISADRRVGLLGLTLINPQTGDLRFTGADGDPDAPREAVGLMLESLGFPQR